MERLFGLVPDAVEVTDLDGRVSYVNAAFEQLTGYKRSEIVARNAWRVLRYDHDVEPAMLRRIRDRQPWSARVVIRTSSGEPRHVDVTASPILDDRGELEAMLTIRREVTFPEPGDRRDFYQQVFQDNRAIKLLVDPETGEIADANDAAARFYGYTRDALRAMRIDQINALPEGELAAALADAKSSDRTHFRFPHRLASGEMRRVEVYSGPVTLDGRRMLFSIIQDITERERAEAALALSEARFRTVVEQLPAGVVVHREGRIVYANEAGAALFGWRAAELVGTMVLDHVHPDSRAHVIRRIAEVEARRGIVPPERSKLRRKDGTVFEAEVRGVMLEFDGQPSVMGVIADTAERDRLEAQLRTAQRMEAVGRLAGGVAHDFNNLLLVILNVSRLLSRRVSPDDPLQQHVEHIEDAARRAAELTRQLLLFARGAEPVAEPVDLAAVLVALAPLLRGSLGSRIALDVSGVTAGCFVGVARVHLEQIIVNLAVNARDAMPDGGALVLETGRTDGAVRLVVRDTGAGMTPDVAAHAFEPFFTTKQLGHGTGLGLSITYGIVQRAGGEIVLDTAPGEGTAFTITLPAAAPVAEPRAATAPTPASAAGSETILVVDDEAEIRTTLVRMLADHGYRALEAADAEAATRLLLSTQIDLLMTDVIMPRVTGPELADRLRMIRPELRVLYMSGYTGDALPEPDAVIRKPFDEHQLLASLRAVLDG